MKIIKAKGKDKDGEIIKGFLFISDGYYYIIPEPVEIHNECGVGAPPHIDYFFNVLPESVEIYVIEIDYTIKNGYKTDRNSR